MELPALSKTTGTQTMTVWGSGKPPNSYLKSFFSPYSNVSLITHKGGMFLHRRQLVRVQGKTRSNHRVRNYQTTLPVGAAIWKWRSLGIVKKTITTQGKTQYYCQYYRVKYDFFFLKERRKKRKL